MRRRCFRKPAVTLSLFPFLAVLVCTMGALIVLLVSVVQKARVDVNSVAQAVTQPENAQAADESLQMEIDVHVWRRQVLEKQREALRQQLAKGRMQLSHLEDHIRRLETRWRELSVQATELEQLDASEQQSKQARADELERLRQEIEKTRQKLTGAREKAAQKPRTFAIVPYKGPNGTNRRPIYVECTDQGITLQPEGIVLRPEDFEGSLGPGNPLDAALRTTREYLAKHGDNARHGEPYPLLIVRPSGTIAYAVARAAIKSWDDEFGYELIDAEMQLEYPEPDAILHRELERSIADARSRQAILAVAMPGRFKRAGSAGLVATTSGGFRPAADGDILGGFMPGGGTAGKGSSFSSSFRPPSSSSGASGAGSGYGGSTYQVSHHGAPGPASSSTGATAGGSAGARQSGGAGTGVAGGTAGSGSGSPTAGSPTASGASTSSNGETSSASSSGSTFGSAGQAGESSEMAIGLYNRKQKQNGAGDSKPLAASRGENWGLPNRGQAATGFTRYIQVQCLADRLLVLPERGDHRNPTVIAMPGAMAESIDPFVSAVWKRMESWGIAAEGGYWKPVLRVQVAPEAEGRFEELCTLLAGSGFVIERK